MRNSFCSLIARLVRARNPIAFRADPLKAPPPAPACALLLYLLLSSIALGAAPSISGFSPSSGAPGSVISIHGSHFDSNPNANWVRLDSFNSVNVTVVSASSTQLSVLIPPEAVSGRFRIEVEGQVGSSGDTFVVWPTIRDMSPRWGPPGTSIIIKGRSFNANPASNSVTFGGVAAIVSSANTEQLVVTVPAAAQSGAVAVTSNGGTGTSLWPFDVTSTGPAIEAFTPGVGSAGTTVTIKGKNFSSITSENAVTLNGSAAIVSSATSTAISFAVPSGATSGSMQVTTHGVTTTSTNAFQVAQSGTLLVPDGASIRAESLLPGQSTDLQFNGVAGQNLGLGISSVIQNPVSSTKKPYVSVFNPNGSLLLSLSCPAYCTFDLSNLPSSGTYIVRLFPNNAASSLSATASLTTSPEISLFPGSPETIQLDRIGKINRVTFSGISGQTRLLKLKKSFEPDYALTARIEVRRSNGDLLTSRGNVVSCANSCASSYYLANLPDTGEYTLVVRTLDESSLSLTVELVEPLQLIADGPSVAAQAALPLEVGFFTFDVMENDRTDLGIIVPITSDFQLNKHYTNRVAVALYNQQGVLVTEIPSCDSKTGEVSFIGEGCALAFSESTPPGTYYVLIRKSPNQSDVTGPTRFIATLSRPFGTSLTIDGAQGVLILDRPGQTGLISFVGDSGQNVQIKGNSQFNSQIHFPFKVNKPDGSLLANLPMANLSGAMDLPALPVSGTYVIEESAQGRKIQDRRIRIPLSLSTLQSCSERAASIPTRIEFISVAPNLVTLEESYFVTLNVTAAASICGSPQGTVKISSNTSSCTYSLGDSSGCLMPALASGQQSLSFAFTPTDPTMFAYSYSSANNAVSVVRKSVDVGISAISPAPSETGQPYSVQFSVTPVLPQAVAPTGQVTVTDNYASCSAMLPATSCSIIASTPGPRSVTAFYQGNASYEARISAPVSHDVALGVPTITQFSPASGLVGATVTIDGTNFSTVVTDNIVRFNGIAALPTSATMTRIVAKVPAAASTGPISVAIGERTATSAANFVVTPPPPPAITSFTPASGLVGATVTINGANFATTTTVNTVTFNGTPANVLSATATRLTAAVPPYATSGPISVTVGNLTATSANSFTVTPPPSPTVSSFTPTSGVVGIPVTINGQNFGLLSSVSFNGSAAFVTQASATRLVALVPRNATTGRIQVEVDGRSVTSSASFTVIPAGQGIASVKITSVSAEPSIVGQAYGVQVTVTPVSPTTPSPTGAIIVGEGANTCLIVRPATTCTLAGSSEPGESILRASYTGDVKYAPSQSAEFVHITNPAVPTEICGFAPNVVPNDPTGFVSITHLSGAIYTPGLARTIIGSGPPAITITNPPEGSQTAEASIDVSGTVNGPMNTGITINGIAGHVVRGRFLVPNVPLSEGSNSLTAVVTTLPGGTASASSTVVRTGVRRPVVVHAEQAVGMVPATIIFDLDIGDLPGGAQIANIAFDPDGDGTFEYSATALSGLPLRMPYQRAGLYFAAFRVTDSNDQTYEATQPVLIRSAADERVVMCDVYGYLKGRLAAQDAIGAGSAYDASVRSRYVDAFAAMGTGAPLIAPKLGTVVSGFIGPRYAELLIMRDNEDATRSGYHVHMIHDADGVWRILGM